MAQTLQQDNMRGNKRPRYDDDSVDYPNAVPVNIVIPNFHSDYPDHSLNTQANLTVDNTSDPNQNSHLLTNTSCGTQEIVPDHSRFTEPDMFSQWLSVDEDVFSSSYEEENTFARIGPSSGRSSWGTLDSWVDVPQNHQVAHGPASSSLPGPSQGGTEVEVPPDPLARTSRGGPTEQEWEERRPFITYLYGPEKPNLNLTLRELMRAMEKAGFLKGATDNMYKNRFSKWGIVKNNKSPARRNQTRRRQSAVTAGGDTSLIPSPPRPSSSTAGGPVASFGEVVKYLRAICVESMKQSRPGLWDLSDEFCVKDDDWEDAYGSAAALTVELSQNPDSSAADHSWDTIQDDITPMIQTLNYFSVPTTLMIAHLMCKKLENAKVRHVPACFLEGCLGVSRAESERSSRHVWLTRLLEGLYNFTQRDNDVGVLAEILSLTITCYIQLVTDYDDRDGATGLSLLSFYHVQLGSDIFWLTKTLERITSLLERVEAAKGQDDKATIEILGLAIMVLQETGQDGNLRFECLKMRKRCERQLRKLPDGHPDRKFYLDRLLDGYHLETRLALDMGDQSLANQLKEEYEELERNEEKKKDGFARILDLEIEKMTSRLDETGLGSR